MIKKFVWLHLNIYNKPDNSGDFANLMGNDKLLNLTYYKRLANKAAYIRDPKVFELVANLVSSSPEIDEYQFKKVIDIAMSDNGVANLIKINNLVKKIDKDSLDIILNLDYKDNRFSDVIEQILYIMCLLEDHVFALDVEEVKNILFRRILNNNYSITLVGLNELKLQIYNNLQYRVAVKNTENLKEAVEKELSLAKSAEEQFTRKMNLPKNRRV